MVDGITINVRDPKLYHALLMELKSKGYRVVNDGGIILTDGDEKGIDATVKVKSEEDILPAIGKVAVLSRRKEKFNELLIGVDTNPPYNTVAVVGDGELIDYYVRIDVASLCELFAKLISAYPHKRHLIGIGTGNVFGHQVLSFTREFFPDAKKVDEFKSSSRNHFNNIKDADLRAAFAIAIRASRE